MLAKIPRPTIFAHRGASAYAPENTLAAFELAIQQAADAIEMDVKLTADGEVVVIHDQTLDRTTGKSGRVGKSTLAELRTLDAGSHFDISFKGEPLPTLSDVFEKIGKRILYNIELTNYASLTDDLPEKTAALVEAYDLVGEVLFSSFNPLALIRVRRRLPAAPIALLAGGGIVGRLARSGVGALLAYQALHVAYPDVTPELVAATHRRNCRLHVYTVNDKDEMLRLLNLGVDGIFTDDPPLARQVFQTARLEKEQ